MRRQNSAVNSRAEMRLVASASRTEAAVQSGPFPVGFTVMPMPIRNEAYRVGFEPSLAERGSAGHRNSGVHTQPGAAAARAGSAAVQSNKLKRRIHQRVVKPSRQVSLLRLVGRAHV